MDTYQPRQRAARPLSDDEVEHHAVWLLRALCDGVILHHYRQPDDATTDAVVTRLRALAREAGVRLVVKREMESGRVRYRLRRRREGE